MKKAIWISWEDHRRSRELSDAFGADLYTLGYKGNALVRYILLSAKTALILSKSRPKYVFVQNPSIVLTAVACLLKSILGYVLIVDRHSNFKLASINSRKPKWFFFHLLSRYTVKKADFTIITNENLKKLVEDWGGKGLVLQDRLPNLDPNTILAKLPGDINIMCVTTYSSDEPIFEIAEAASSLLDVNFYFTGRYSSYRHIKEFEAIKPSNVTLTGFISEAEYIALMRGVDYVMVLTTEDDLLTCGAYEAVAEEKPMILSNTKAIIEYFNKGAIYTGPETYELKQAVEAACRMKDNLTNDVKLLKSELTSSWAETFEQLVQKITSSDRNNDHTGS